MIRVNTAELQRDVERYVDLTSTEAVAIAAVSGEDRAVLVSAKEYDRLKRRDREVSRAEDLTDEELDAIERTEAPAGSEAFDHEVR